MSQGPTPSRKKSRREWDRAYRERNHDKVLATKARYRAKHREKIRRKDEEYRETHKEAILQRCAEYRRTHHEQIVAHRHVRRARLKKAAVGDVKAIVRWAKLWRDQELVACHWCRQLKLPWLCHMDHMHPLVLGGRHSLENLCVSCPRCNSQKQGKPLSEWLQILRSRGHRHV